MKLGVSLVLVACSLSVLGEDGREQPDAGTNAPALTSNFVDFQRKLEWNVDPRHWDELLSRIQFTTPVGAAGSGLFLSGDDPSNSDYSHATTTAGRAPDEARAERVLRRIEPPAGWRLGQSDYVISSPILEGLLPRRAPDGASLGEKLLDLPVVRLLKPLPMPDPPGGGPYFKWANREQAWAEYSQPEPGPGRRDNGM